MRLLARGYTLKLMSKEHTKNKLQKLLSEAGVEKRGIQCAIMSVMDSGPE